jgi:hypothetical protein
LSVYAKEIAFLYLPSCIPQLEANSSVFHVHRLGQEIYSYRSLLEVLLWRS